MKNPIEKGVVSADDVQRNLEFLDSRDQWMAASDYAEQDGPDFKKRLLEDGTAAVGEMGLTMGDAEPWWWRTPTINNRCLHSVFLLSADAAGLRRTGISPKATGPAPWSNRAPC